MDYIKKGAFVGFFWVLILGWVWVLYVLFLVKTSIAKEKKLRESFQHAEEEQRYKSN